MIATLQAAGAKSPTVSVSYGQTETQSGLVECCQGSGMHNPLPEAYYWQAVDPETHAAMPDGESGLALLTHIDRRGTVLLRYALGDRIALDATPCPHCGAIGQRVVSTPARSDGRLKIKGTLVEIDTLVDAVRSLVGNIVFVIVLDKANDDPLGNDRLTVKLAQAPEGGLADAIVLAVKQRFQVTPEFAVDPAILLAINDSQKRRYFIDQRPKVTNN
jgi:phenylacetate-coenzyme A ligase PaaK-like adenylate-forming protein